MFLHRKETERLSNPWWWRPMQALVFLLVWPPYLVVGLLLAVFGTVDDVCRTLYAWNRCEITSRPRPWWKRLFEPRRRSPPKEEPCSIEKG